MRILEVVVDSPAAGAGLRKNDLVVEAAGAPVETLDDVVRAMVLGHPPEIEIGIVRDGRRETLAIRPRQLEKAA